jgi:heme-degrading monooxygenase HmoA
MLTFINVFTVLPEKQQDALKGIERVYREVVSQQSGFISAQLLTSQDGSRVTAIAPWQTEADLQAMRATQKFKDLHDRNFYEAIVSNDGHIYDGAIAIE